MLKEKMKLFLGLLLFVLLSSCSFSPAFLSYPQEPSVFLLKIGVDDNYVKYCTGTLFTENTLLTAAHCLVEVEQIDVINKKNLKVNEGIYYTYHPKYVQGESDYDIGLIRLKNPIPSNTVRLGHGLFKQRTLIKGFPGGEYLSVRDCEINRLRNKTYLVNGGIEGGMSGGPLYNVENNELLGIIVFEWTNLNGGGIVRLDAELQQWIQENL